MLAAVVVFLGLVNPAVVAGPQVHTVADYTYDIAAHDARERSCTFMGGMPHEADAVVPFDVVDLRAVSPCADSAAASRSAITTYDCRGARACGARTTSTSSNRGVIGNPVALSLHWATAAAETGGDLLNAAGRAYPKVIDARTGDAIPAPPSGLSKVPVGDRVPWGAQERGAYIKDWYDQGYSTPEGGWSQYDIHHIIPREYGGTNDFNNLVPVLRTVHQQEFNPWWMNYGG
jgi:hypothetical protein